MAARDQALDFLGSPAFLSQIIFLLCMDLHLLMFDIQAQMVVDAHVLVRYPHQGEERDQVTAPVVVQQFESSKNEKRRRNIMAETVFTSE